MDIKDIVPTLHHLEIKVLPILASYKNFSEIVSFSKLKEVEVMRALQWLQNKGVLNIQESSVEMVDLDSNGKTYLKEGLPEKRLLRTIESAEKSTDDIMKSTNLSQEELNVSIGVLKKQASINLSRRGSLLYVSITGQGKRILGKDSLEEQFLKKRFPLQVDLLKPEERFAYGNLIKRKSILKRKQLKTKSVKLTSLGQSLVKHKFSKEEIIDRLTPSLIKSGNWRNKGFRAYDVGINVPRIYGGRRHFINEVIEYSKRIWLDLGFREMKGPLINTSFWNFDSLFVPQDHPARELQDTFFIKDPDRGKLPGKNIVNRIKQSHETGGNTSSTGWDYKWEPEKARKNVLRTHTTVLSAKTLNELKKQDWPAKYFSLGRCFRNETLDWKHLFEFNQTEGIVVDPDANFRHLLGYLKEFFRKMGFPQARFRPAFFPYTEPSIEIDVFHPVHKEWMELGGAGIFRPEVTEPLLGEEVPVLAWGPGFDRIIMDYYSINDMRDLYKNDLEQLRTIKSWLR